MPTYTLVHSTTFAGNSASTPAAGQPIFDGWIDKTGAWSVNSTDGLVYSGVSFTTDYVYRSADGTALSCRQVLVSAPRNAGNGTLEIDIAEVRKQADGSAYASFYDGSALYIKVLNGGANIATAPFSGLQAGHAYAIDLRAEPNTGGGTNVTTTLYDVTADPSMASPLVTASATGDTTGPQTAGYWGIAGVNGVRVASVKNYSGDPVSASAVAVSGSSSPAQGTASNYTVGANGTLSASKVVSLSATNGSLSASSVTLTPASPTATVNLTAAAQGAGRITATASGLTTGILDFVATGPPLVIGLIGDSITAQEMYVSEFTAIVSKATGRPVTLVDRGISGTHTGDWQPGGSNLSAALGAFASAGVPDVLLMLGTNNLRGDQNTTAVTYDTQYRAILGAIQSAGYRVVVNYSPWTVPLSTIGGYTWPSTCMDLMAQYRSKLDALPYSATLVQGDRQSLFYFEGHPSELSDGIHPSATGGNSLGQMWAGSYLASLSTGGGATARGYLRA